MKTFDEVIEAGEPIDSTIPALLLDSIVFSVQELLRERAEEERAKGAPLDDTDYTLGLISGLLITGDAAEQLLILDKDWSRDPEVIDLLNDYEKMIHNLTQPGMPWDDWGDDRDTANEKLQAALNRRRGGDPQ